MREERGKRKRVSVSLGSYKQCDPPLRLHRRWVDVIDLLGGWIHGGSLCEGGRGGGGGSQHKQYLPDATAVTIATAPFTSFRKVMAARVLQLPQCHGYLTADVCLTQSWAIHS